MGLKVRRFNSVGYENSDLINHPTLNLFSSREKQRKTKTELKLRTQKYIIVPN